MVDLQASNPVPENAEMNIPSTNDAGTTEPQTNGESSSSAAPKICEHCKKSETDPEKPLKPCPKCHSVQYCSRDCQKAAFKAHKKICASAAQIYAQNADIKLASPRAPKQDRHRNGLQKWQFDTST